MRLVPGTVWSGVLLLMVGARFALAGGTPHDGTFKARVWAVDPPARIGTVLYRPAQGYLKAKIKFFGAAGDDVPCSDAQNEVTCVLTDRAWVPGNDAWIDTHLWFRLEPSGSVAQLTLTDSNLVAPGGTLHNVWGTCFREPTASPVLDRTAAPPFGCVGRDLPPVVEPSGAAAAMF